MTQPDSRPADCRPADSGPADSGPADSGPANFSRADPYRVLARKYRPSSFADLRGQEVLVRTLSNAIASGRIAHAFLLTGIRGIGKTTTARIIARALNCVGPDKDGKPGDGGPTIHPCGVCANCAALAEDRHMDVIEMDAATNTGVDNVRDIVEAVQYAPALGRYKIFIIDEVHMLSKSAFNALLKTLEEPPPYIKFIFATTELRKIPVTILSRCQRFDLRRLETEALAAHLTDICGQEAVAAEPEALTLIATAGDGSVRDALSLLDQAIAHSVRAEGGIRIETATVRDMLGLVDRSQLFALLEALARGDAGEALGLYRLLYAAGAEVATLLEDLAEIVHFITQVKLDPALAEDVTFSQGDREAAKQLAAQLNIPALSRLWQMLLKGLQEVQTAPNPHSAVQMVLIRTAYAGTLPTPGDIIQQIQSGKLPTGTPGGNISGGNGGAMNASGGINASGGNGGGAMGAGMGANSAAAPRMAPAPAPTSAMTSAPTSAMTALPTSSFAAGDPIAARMASPSPAHAGMQEAAARRLPQPGFAEPEPQAAAAPIGQPLTQEEALSRFAELALLFEKPEPILFHYLQREAWLVGLETGRLELKLSRNVPKEAAGEMGKFLTTVTGQRWVVILSQESTASSLQEYRDAARKTALAQLQDAPLVQAALAAFPGAELVAVTDA